MKPLSATLPPLYAAWIDALLDGGSIPAETAATCDDCAMAPPPGESTPAGPAQHYFDAGTKCCTYVPDLPNFLAGRILLDRDPGLAHGRASLEARIRAGVAVTPLGVAPPPTFLTLYRSMDQAFGRAPSLLCMHYEAEGGGRCGIWRHRMSTCATWFCKFVRGAEGREFWGALHGLLQAIERALSTWCVLEIDPGAEAIGALFPPPMSARSGAGRGTLDRFALEEVADPAAHARVWGRFAGRERELFERAARLVARLSWRRVLAIGGAQVAVRARRVQDAHRSLLDETLPERVALGEYHVIATGPEVSRICGYSGYDPLEVPSALVRALPDLARDDRPLSRSLARIREEHGLRIARAVVRKLLDFGILRPV